MSQICMVTELDTVRTRPGGSATANFWLEINGRQFPGHNWNDFVVVLMSRWTMALFRLLRGLNLRKVVKERVHFMEGPYAVEVSMPSSGLLRLRGLAGVDRDIEWEVGEAPALPFILGLISQSREALGACRRQAWWSRDAEILESSLETLKNESEKLPG